VLNQNLPAFPNSKKSSAQISLAKKIGATLFGYAQFKGGLQHHAETDTARRFYTNWKGAF